MTEEIINPFNQVKKVDWAKKAQNKLKEKQVEEKLVKKPKIKSSNIKRIAKSFKVYPGEIVKNFDKRVNKLQVKFDDLDFDKDYVDSGKYIMFLMAFAEKYDLYDLYTRVDKNGNFNLDSKELKKFLDKLK